MASPPALLAPFRLNGTDVTMPRVVYGLAWKRERTADLAYKALQNGFTGIDTAAQPRQ